VSVAQARDFVPVSDERRDRPSIDFVLLALAVGVALIPCARFWNANPEYFFGWGVPVLAAYLFGERWSARPIVSGAARGSRTPLCVVLAGWILALLLDRLLVESEPGWRPALWVEMSLVAGALLAWCGLCGGRAWVRYFAFPISFLFLGVPWIFNLELPVVQGLMRLNTDLVADSLLLADIPARAAGNTLRLSTGLLGVEEACSGIRSLQAALMMSIFLGEFYRLSLPKRLLLPVGAVIFALAGNYGRLLFLAWRGAHAGIPAVAAIHDSAGGAILLFTIAGLWLFSLGLRGAGKPLGARAQHGEGRSSFRFVSAGNARGWAWGLLLGAIAVEAGTRAWYDWREQTAPRYPAWTVELPTGVSDFHPIPISPATRDLLRYDAARTGTWRDAQGWRWSALWFRYRPKTGNKIVFDSHNPEICLPGAGLREVREEASFPLRVRGVWLEVRDYLFAAPAGEEHVFWIAYRNRGNVAPFTARQGVYGTSLRAFFQRSLAWGRDAWKGCRGTDAETLEVAVTGPEDVASARRAAALFLENAVVPEQAVAIGPTGR
jgi:exosortase